MKEYKTVLFDLDGTVVDTAEGIFNSIRYTAKKMGLTVPPDEELYYFMGPPLQHSFEKVFSLDSGAAERAVATYREYYREGGIYECSPFEGICELIRELAGAGRELYLATAKPTVFAEKVIGHIGLTDSFKEIVGSFLDGRRSQKAEVIGHILESYPEIVRESAIMVGDTHLDIRGANAHGLDSVAVGYGPGNMELIKEAGPSYIVDTVAELKELLMR